MTGKPDNEILAEREVCLTFLKTMYPEHEISLIDNFIPDFKGKYIERIGETVKLLAQADIIVFTEDWEKSTGCRIEHYCCEECNIPFCIINNLSAEGV